MREATIVIPTRDHWDMTRACVAEIRRHESARVVVVDNGSRTRAPKELDADVVVCDGSLTAAWNAGCAAVCSGFVVLMNNDVEVSGPFVEALCRTNHVSGAAMRFDDDARMVVLEGWCLAFERTLWERLGGFDERMALYFQDTDFQRRAAALGVATREAAVPLKHLGHRTAHDAKIVDQTWRRNRWAADRAAFRERWR